LARGAASRWDPDCLVSAAVLHSGEPERVKLGGSGFEFAKVPARPPADRCVRHIVRDWFAILQRVAVGVQNAYTHPAALRVRRDLKLRSETFERMSLDDAQISVIVRSQRRVTVRAQVSQAKKTVPVAGVLAVIATIIDAK
jgi:hypothetical protein